MDAQSKDQLICDAVSTRRRAGEYAMFLRDVIRKVALEILPFEDMIAPLQFKTGTVDVTDFGATQQIINVSTSLAHIHVAINMLNTQKNLAEESLKIYLCI